MKKKTGITLALCLSLLFLNACSSKTPVRSSKPATTQVSEKEVSPEVEEIPKPRTSLSFTKEESGELAIDFALKSKPQKTTENINSDAILKAGKATKRKIDFSRVSFGEKGSLYVANFDNTFEFDYDKSEIRSEDSALLDSFSNLYESGVFGKHIFVIGHTDSDGSESYNYGLSARRARAVAALLEENDIPVELMSLVPAGEYLPKAANSTAAGKQKNRRVEVISSDSKALIQSYLRQLKCPDNENCERKLLNIFGVSKNGNNIEIAPHKLQRLATFSPELNKLKALNTALNSGSSSNETRLISTDDSVGLIEIGEPRKAFTIPLDLRPVFKLEQERRNGFKVPQQFIIHN